MAWLIGSILAAEAIWLIPSYVDKSRRVWRDAEAEVRKLVRVTVDPQAPHSLISEMAIYRRLKNQAGFAGMRIENDSGETLSVLGRKPALSGMKAKRDGLDSRLSSDGKYLDVFFPNTETKLEHNIVTRVELSEYYAKLSEWLHSMLTAIAAITALLAAIGYAALYFAIVRPVLHMHKAMAGAMAYVEKGEAIQIGMNRQDEIGGIADYTNMMLRELARSYNTSMAIATRAIEESSIATIVYSSENVPIYASRSALELFEVSAIDQLTPGDERFLRMIKDGKATDCSVSDALEDGPFVAEVSVVSTNGNKKMLCVGYYNDAEVNEVREKTLQFADPTVYLRRLDELLKERENESRRRKDAERQALRAKLMLESCMTLMEPADAIKPLAGGLVDLQVIIRSWAQQRGSAGLGRPIRYNELPKISGNNAQLEAIFNQALGFIDFRSIFDASELRVVAESRSGMISFELSEKAGEDRTLNKRAGSTGSEEWTLCFAALSRLVSAVGGAIESDPQKPGPARLQFSLPKIVGSRSFDAADDEAA